MHFGENQLSLSLIGLSPLSTGHPKAFQRLPVRSSSGSYPTFNLPMDRSLSFGSAATDYGPHKMQAFYGYPSRPIQTRFRFGSGSPLNLASDHNSQAHYAKGSPSHLYYRSNSIVLRMIVSHRFQVLFHSAHRGPFHLSLTVLVRYRSGSSI